jgi:MFS family permease
VVVTETIPLYTAAPPYNFSSSAQGLTFLSTTIGTILGAIVCGKPNDWVAQYWAKRNKGVFEPEMRLPFMLVPQILVTVGLILFGVGFHNHWHWIIPLIGDAFIGSGIAGMGAVFQPYLMDSYPAVVNDVLIVSLSTLEKISYTVANSI